MEIKDFWTRVKLRLREKNLSQIAAAKACGRSLYTFKGWMAKGIVPPLEDAYDLARFLGVSLDYLINGRGEDNASRINVEVQGLLKKASQKLMQM